MIALFAATLLAVIPVHGLVIESFTNGTAIVRIDPVAEMLPAQTRRYRLSPQATFHSGTAIDALLDPSSHPATLQQAIAAASFAPGLPNAAGAVPVRLGGTLPTGTLVDQNGSIVQLAQAFRGKTLLLSFVFTRCPDRTLCPAISAKFAYLQQHLDAKQFALAEITLDPQYDSPNVLRNYGASYGARLPNWTLLTGTGSTTAHLLDEFQNQLDAREREQLSARRSSPNRDARRQDRRHRRDRRLGSAKRARSGASSLGPRE